MAATAYTEHLGYCVRTNRDDQVKLAQSKVDVPMNFAGIVATRNSEGAEKIANAINALPERANELNELVQKYVLQPKRLGDL